MTRSAKKGPYVDEKVFRKVQKAVQAGSHEAIKTWARACTIVPEFIGMTFMVHNGKLFHKVLVTEDMVGHRLGEFSHTKKFHRHGGKMQKELDTKQKEAEITAAQSAKAAVEAKK